MASNIQPTGLDWKNLPNKTTPISAENLNKMSNTIDDLVEAVNPLNTVEANPEDAPTEGLEKVEIDGTVYEVKGGHKILNDVGTTLAQKDNLQFKGVYTQNNGDNTEVDICRTMTKAQMEALSGESLKGFINTSDEPDSLPLTAEWVAYDSNTSVKNKIDSIDSRTQLYFKDITTTTDNYGHIQLGSIYNLSVWAITNMFIIAPNNFHCILYTYNAIPYIEVRDLSNTRQPNTEIKIRIVGYINVPIEAT